MTKEEREAREWLRAASLTAVTVADRECTRTIQSLLDQPRLPEEPPYELKAALGSYWPTCGIHRELQATYEVYRIFQKHLTPPRKTVWRVSSTGLHGAENVRDFPTAEGAGDHFKIVARSGNAYTIAEVEA